MQVQRLFRHFNLCSLKKGQTKPVSLLGKSPSATLPISGCSREQPDKFCVRHKMSGRKIYLLKFIYFPILDVQFRSAVFSFTKRSPVGKTPTAARVAFVKSPEICTVLSLCPLRLLPSPLDAASDVTSHFFHIHRAAAATFHSTPVLAVAKLRLVPNLCLKPFPNPSPGRRGSRGDMTGQASRYIRLAALLFRIQRS